jgi:hypothetical protein
MTAFFEGCKQNYLVTDLILQEWKCDVKSQASKTLINQCFLAFFDKQYS